MATMQGLNDVAPGKGPSTQDVMESRRVFSRAARAAATVLAREGDVWGFLRVMVAVAQSSQNKELAGSFAI